MQDRLSDFFAWREVRDQRGIWQDGIGRRDTIGQPRNIRNQTYIAMTVLEELIDTSNALLKDKPDKLMSRFSVTHPEFYDAYLRAGTIVD